MNYAIRKAVLAIKAFGKNLKRKKYTAHGGAIKANIKD